MQIGWILVLDIVDAVSILVRFKGKQKRLPPGLLLIFDLLAAALVVIAIIRMLLSNKYLGFTTYSQRQRERMPWKFYEIIGFALIALLA